MDTYAFNKLLNVVCYIKTARQNYLTHAASLPTKVANDPIWTAWYDAETDVKNCIVKLFDVDKVE